MMLRKHPGMGLLPFGNGQPISVRSGGRTFGWDSMRGIWNTRGLGDTPPMPAASSYAATCNASRSWSDDILGGLYLYCLPNDFSNVYSEVATDVADTYSGVAYGTSTYPAPPMPVGPTIAITTDPAAATNPNAVYGGTVNGQAVYAVPSTAQANMDAVKAQLDQFFTGLANTADAAACSHFWSMLDPTCPDQYLGTTTLLIAAGIGAFLLFRGFSK